LYNNNSRGQIYERFEHSLGSIRAILAELEASQILTYNIYNGVVQDLRTGYPGHPGHPGPNKELVAAKYVK
jgi:hypothetical protein